MQTHTNKNGRTRTRKQDQHDLERAESEGMSGPAFDTATDKSTGVMSLFRIRSVADLKDRWAALSESVESQVQERPMAAVGAAIGVGIGIGVLLRKGFFAALVATAATFAVRKFVDKAMDDSEPTGDSVPTGDEQPKH